MEIKRSEIDEVLEFLYEAGHTTASSLIDDTPDLKRVSIVYPEEKRVYDRLVEYLNVLRMYASPA